jgi:MFS family permease
MLKRMVRVSSGHASLGRAAGQPRSWHVLRHRRFLGYFAGSLVSNLGTWLQNTAQMLLAYQLTHSAFAVGLVTCAQFSGFLLFGPRAGNLANRMGRKRVLIGTQLLSAFVAAVLAFLILHGALTEGDLLVGALGTGLALTFALPVQTAMVSALVPDEDTKAALAMNSVSYNGGRTLAPVLYLIVLASVGAGWAFALNAITFVIFAVVIFFVYPPMNDQSRPDRAWSGLRFAVRRPRIMLLLAMVAAVTIADDPVLVLGPSLARQVLSVSSAWPAYFLSALGLGTVLGALLPVRPSTARSAAIPLGVLAISVIFFALGFNPYVSFIAAVVAGVAGLLTGASAQSLLLQQAGPWHATQVMALWAVAWAGTKPLASLTDGWLASYLGIRWAGIFLAAPALGVAFLEICPITRHKRLLKSFIRRYNQNRGFSPSAVAIALSVPPENASGRSSVAVPAKPGPHDRDTPRWARSLHAVPSRCAQRGPGPAGAEALALSVRLRPTATDLCAKDDTSVSSAGRSQRTGELHDEPASSWSVRGRLKRPRSAP